MAFVWNYVRVKDIPVNGAYNFPENSDDKHVEENIVDVDFSCILYALILPIICTIGVFGNITSFFVLLKMKVKCSSYTYLTVKTASDLAICFLVLLSVLAHGFFYNMDGEDFDLLITLPIASIFSGVSVYATVSVTIDRLLLLRNPSRPTKPAICCPQIARRIMLASTFASVVINLPYFFIFVIKEDGFLHPTKFFNSSVYLIYNWIRFTLYGIIPSVVLPIATGLLIVSIKKVNNQLQHLSCKSRTKCLVSTRMTVTLIAIAFFFFISEIPGHIISKKAAFVFLYNGDASSVITDDADLEILRQVSMILGSINCSINFFIFYILHPPFGKGLKQLFCKKKEKKHKQVLVNVFVISQCNVDTSKFKTFMPKLQDLQTFIYR